MTNISKHVQAAYDQIAPVYASHKGSLSGNLLTHAKRLVTHVGKNGRVLDVGCGTGRDLAWLETRDVRAIGVDLSTGMLNQARQSVQGDVLQMDMRQLAFSRASFDGIWSCASLLHLPKSEAPFALLEMRYCLKPGGMLILSIQAGDFEGWNGGYVEGVERFFARYSQAEMHSLLSEAGFVVQNVVSSHVGKRDWLLFICIAEMSNEY